MRVLQGSSQSTVSPTADTAPAPSPTAGGGGGMIPVLPNSSSIPGGGGDDGNTTTVTDWELVSSPVQLRNGVLEQLWMWVYWVTFLLTYVFIPLTQEYVAAGEFSKKGRFCASVKINIIFYAAIGVIAFGALAYVIFGLDQGLWDLMPVLISLANTFGLIIIILLLGYGAAEVPRAIWKNSNPEGMLRRLYFKAPELDGALFDTRNLLKDTVAKIEEFDAKVKTMSSDAAFQTADPRNAALVAELQRCLGIVNRKVAVAHDLLGKGGKSALSAAAAAAAARRRKAEKPEEEEEEEESSGGGFFGGISKTFGGKNSKYKGITPAKLAGLHKKLMLHIFKLRKTQFRFDSLVIQCIELEYVVAKTVPPVPVKRKTAEGETFYVAETVDLTQHPGEKKKTAARNNVFDSKTMAKGGGGGGAGAAGSGSAQGDVLSPAAAEALMSMMCAPRLCGGILNRARWTFKIFAVPYVYKVLAVLAEAMSIMLLWSEATIFVNLTGELQ
jgi:hypothetical protein